MTVSSPLSTQKRRKKGFTLTEIAIVLGIIGLILGAIWGAASSVYSNVKTSDAQNGIVSTAQAVRAMYANAGTIGLAAAATITTPGMFPVAWQDSTTAGVVGNPWNKNPGKNLAYVYGGTGTTFSIELDNITDAGCAALISSFSSAASSLSGGKVSGLVGTSVKTVAAAAGTAAIGATGPTLATFALPTACVGGAGQNDSVAIAFDISKM